MPKVKGSPKTGGRQKGTPNKSTAQTKAAFAKLVTKSLPKMQGWLDRLALIDPGKALDMVAKLAQFNLPMLARTEMVGEDGQPLTLRVEVKSDKTRAELDKLT